MMKKWTVRKGGTVEAGFTRGWFAMSADGQSGAYITGSDAATSFDAAINFATAQADEQFAREQGRNPKHRDGRPAWAEIAAFADGVSA